MAYSGYTARERQWDEGYEAYRPGREPPEDCTESFRAGWRAAQADQEQSNDDAAGGRGFGPDRYPRNP